jgi:copine 5/8/9
MSHFAGFALNENEQQLEVAGVDGILQTYKQVKHCFALNGNEQQPEVAGIDGILQTYYKSLKKVKMSGPTHFSELLAEATMQSMDSLKYHVLMIITDGIVNDTEATIDAIVNASDLPLSIVIVGVGEADFSDMHRLDGDTVTLESQDGKRKAARDIVQFVEWNKIGGLWGQQHADAAAIQFLQELPRQLVDYYKSKDIMPNLPKYQKDSLPSFVISIE